MRRLFHAALLAVVLLAAGCAVRQYHPAPISPPQTAAQLEARTLDAPGLKEFLQQNHVSSPGGSWDLAALTVAAFYYNPGFDVARARLVAAEAAVTSAGARPNPTLGVAPGASASPESPWLFILDFALPLETAGKRGYRAERARKLSEAARLELAGLGWQVRSRVRAALLDHLLALRSLDLLGAEQSVRRQAVELLERRLAVGEVSRPEVDAAKIEQANLSLVIRAVEGQAAQSRAELAAAIGVPVSALDGIALAWPELERPPNEGTLSPAAIQRVAVVDRVDLRRLLAEYAAAETNVQLEMAKQRPDVELGPGYDFDEGHNKYRIGPSLTLPVFNRNEGPIAEAEAKRREIGERFLAVQAQIIGESEKALAAYRAALKELEEADTSLAGLQAQREEMARASFAAGETDRLDLAGVQIQGAVAARARLDSLRRAQTALGALEDAVQKPLQPAAPLPEVSASSPSSRDAGASRRGDEPVPTGAEPVPVRRKRSLPRRPAPRIAAKEVQP
jgi:outer membrane protein TolC